MRLTMTETLDVVNFSLVKEVIELFPPVALLINYTLIKKSQSVRIITIPVIFTFISLSR